MKKMIVFMALILIASISCRIMSPEEPGKTAHVRLKLERREIGHSGFLPASAQNDRKFINSKLTSAGNTSGISGINGLQAIDEARVVFFNIDMTSEELINTYAEKYMEVDEFWNGFSGDPNDFEGYWLNMDAGEFNIVADGKYKIETRGNLSITDSTAHGEFELAKGIKYCRVGFFEGGRLVYIGHSEGESAGHFFEVTVNETKTIYVFYHLITP